MIARRRWRASGRLSKIFATLRSALVTRCSVWRICGKRTLARRTYRAFQLEQASERARMSIYPDGADGLHWRTSRTCDGGACVGVARQGEFIVVGNTANPDAPVSRFTVQ